MKRLFEINRLFAIGATLGAMVAGEAAACSCMVSDVSPTELLAADAVVVLGDVEIVASSDPETRVYRMRVTRSLNAALPNEILVSTPEMGSMCGVRLETRGVNGGAEGVILNLGHAGRDGAVDTPYRVNICSQAPIWSQRENWTALFEAIGAGR